MRDVDLFNRLIMHLKQLNRVAPHRNAAVGDNPTFRPERTGRCTRERINFRLADGAAFTAFIKLSRLALNRNVLAVASPHRYHINPDVALRYSGKPLLPGRPLRPQIGLCDIPLPNHRTSVTCRYLKPLASSVRPTSLINVGDQLFKLCAFV